MNYIEDLIKKNNLNIGDKFAIIGSKKYNQYDKIFYFNKYYALVSDGYIKPIYHNSIFVKLMTGEYTISI